MCRLAGDPAAAVAFLEARVRSAVHPDGRRVRRLIADLDDDSFRAWEAATTELETLGEAADAHLHDALSRRPSVEARRRIERILGKPDALSGGRLRMVRAVEVLESIATPGARAALELLARTVPGARYGEEARLSVERLTRRAAPGPGTDRPSGD
jgi:hypothetical protein